MKRSSSMPADRPTKTERWSPEERGAEPPSISHQMEPRNTLRRQTEMSCEPASLHLRVATSAARPKAQQRETWRSFHPGERAGLEDNIVVPTGSRTP